MLNFNRIVKGGGFFVIISGLLLSCTTSRKQSTRPDYFEYKKMIRDGFSTINKNIFKVYSAADYETFTFPSDSQVRKENLGAIDESNYPTNTSTETTRGTATLIHGDDKKQVFLASYHVFNYADTVFDYYYRDDGTRTPFIAQLSVKTGQKHIVKKHMESTAVELVAYNKKQDIAYIAGEVETNAATRGQQTQVNMASEKALRTGTEVFVSGFPSGYSMVTRGLLSKPLSEKTSKVLIDAPFNKGYSGAPFFILSPDCRCFKLAGIVTSSALTKKNILVPEFQRHEKTYDPKSIYTDPTYVNQDKRIKYGVTFGIGINTIEAFYINNKEKFRENDVLLDHFFE